MNINTLSSKINFLHFGKNNSNIYQSNNYAENNIDTKTAFFCVNDIHGNWKSLSELTTASDVFTKKYDEKNITNFRISSGDILAGKGEILAKTVAKFMELAKINIAAIGNHEFDIENMDTLAEILESTPANMKFVSNFKTKNTHPLDKLMSKNDVITYDSGDITVGKVDKKILRTCIIEKKRNGKTEKYGFIGALPTKTDCIHDISRFENRNIEAKDFNEAKDLIQKQVKYLEHRGINKIVLLSHLGYEHDIKIANEIPHIDLISGGHSHTLLKGIEKDVNLFINEEEPVLIVQNERDGKYFGEVQLEFDKKGIIQKAINTVKETAMSGLAKYPAMEKAFDETLQGKEIIAKFKLNKKSFTNKDGDIDRFKEQKAYAHLLTDAIKKQTSSDIALTNISVIRTPLEDGKVSVRDVKYGLLPMDNPIAKKELTGQDLIDSIEYSLTKQAKPVEQVVYSGLEYDIDNGKSININIIDENGNQNPIEANKKYTVSMPDFLSGGGLGYNMLTKGNIIEQKTSVVEAFINYLKKEKNIVLNQSSEK